jgi:hypothetical protein
MAQRVRYRPIYMDETDLYEREQQENGPSVVSVVLWLALIGLLSIFGVGMVFGVLLYDLFV